MASKEELAQIIKTVLGLERGTYLVITTEGEAKLVREIPTIHAVHRAISTADRRCVRCDTINLEVIGAGRTRGDRIVMMVDDTGMIDDLPINQLAFYIANMIKGYPHDIHGTAVVLNDEDFA